MFIEKRGKKNYSHGNNSLGVTNSFQYISLRSSALSFASISTKNFPCGLPSSSLPSAKMDVLDKCFVNSFSALTKNFKIHFFINGIVVNNFCHYVP